MKYLLISLALMALSPNTHAQTPTRSEVVEVNGVKLYYEVYGKGKPLLMLHGYTQSSKVWKEFVDEYANDYTVYLVDLPGHGKSSLFTDTFSVKSATADVLALLETLNLNQIRGIGFSFGGDVLLQLSSMMPEMVMSMVVIGSNAAWNAQDYPDMLATFTYENIEEFTWIRDFHAGGEDQVKSVIEQLSNYKIKMSDDELRRIKAKTLLVLGDREQISIQSVVDLHQKIDNAALWIMPVTGHYAHTGENKSEFLRISKKFLAESE